jgi:hypothetical protein
MADSWWTVIAGVMPCTFLTSGYCATSHRVQLVYDRPVLRPVEEVVETVLDGWRNQQLSRSLQFDMILAFPANCGQVTKLLRVTQQQVC